MNKSNSQLSYPEQLTQAENFFRQHDDFLVVSHIHPDGDAASSTCAVGMILQHLHKNFIMINEGNIPVKFNYLHGYERVADHSKQPLDCTFRYVIAVDCADYDRIGEVSKSFAPDVFILNIDHHPTNDFYGSDHLIKDDASATAEILYDLIEHMQIPLNKELAECIYTGLLTDTGGFRYSNTSPKVMNIASILLKHGVIGYELAERLLETITLPHILLLKKALANLSFAMNHQIGWISVSAQDIEATGANSEDLEGLVNYPRNIEGVEVGLLFKETVPGTIKVSFRSTGKVNVSHIAKHFGGGGHVKASGCTIEGTLDEAVQKVLHKIEQALL